jgi:3-oxoadipate enol-lactonase
MSLGGCVAQSVATLSPDRVEALVLVDTTAWYGEGAPEAWAMRAATAREKGLSSLAGFQIDRWFGEGFPEEHPELCDRLLAIFVANDIDAYVATCHALGAVDLRERVSSIDIPTGIVVGEFDGATPVSDAEDLRDRIAGSTLRIIERAKHLTPLERPDVVADVVRRTTSRR